MVEICGITKSLSLNVSEESTLFQVMAWCHYLNQCWPRFTSPYSNNWLQWVDTGEKGSKDIWGEGQYRDYLFRCKVSPYQAKPTVCESLYWKRGIFKMKHLHGFQNAVMFFLQGCSHKCSHLAEPFKLCLWNLLNWSLKDPPRIPRGPHWQT